MTSDMPDEIFAYIDTWGGTFTCGPKWQTKPDAETTRYIKAPPCVDVDFRNPEFDVGDLQFALEMWGNMDYKNGCEWAHHLLLKYRDHIYTALFPSDAPANLEGLKMDVWKNMGDTDKPYLTMKDGVTTITPEQLIFKTIDYLASRNLIRTSDAGWMPRFPREVLEDGIRQQIERDLGRSFVVEHNIATRSITKHIMAHVDQYTRVTEYLGENLIRTEPTDEKCIGCGEESCLGGCQHG